MRVLLLGAAGFVGSHVLDALGDDPAVHVVAGFHERVPASPPPRAEARTVDLLSPKSLGESLSGVDAVIHAASYVGRDSQRVEDVNILGTRNLVAALAERPHARLVYASTTSVYGTGPHRGVAEDEIPLNPESPVSVAKVAAERLVLDAGGKVVRAAPVLGIGDRWFGAAVLQGAFALGGLPGGGTARISVVTARQLGSALALTATSFDHVAPRVLHAAHPQPTSIADLVELLTRGTGRVAPTGAIPQDEAERRARELGFTSHQLALISTDHWYDSAAMSALLPGASALGLTPAEQSWYAEVLRAGQRR